MKTINVYPAPREWLGLCPACGKLLHFIDKDLEPPALVMCNMCKEQLFIKKAKDPNEDVARF